MTTIDGVASVRPSASGAAACSTVSARAQVSLRDQRRNCEAPCRSARPVQSRANGTHPVSGAFRYLGRRVNPPVGAGRLPGIWRLAGVVHASPKA
jgi:hypothetical protein